MDENLEKQYPYRVRVDGEEYHVNVNRAGTFHRDPDVGTIGCYLFCARCSDTNPSRDKCLRAQFETSVDLTIRVQKSDFVVTD
jgi:hypothetical protein